MQLANLDWGIIAAFFLFSLLIGIIVARKAGSTAEFFLSGRNMPWWLLGVSMVATTFSADTPNLVNGYCKEQWSSWKRVWWAFLLTGMLTVFVYAKPGESGVFTILSFTKSDMGEKCCLLRGF